MTQTGPGPEDRPEGAIGPEELGTEKEVEGTEEVTEDENEDEEGDDENES